MIWLALAISLSTIDPNDANDLIGAWRFQTGDDLSFALPSIDDRGWVRKHLPTEDARWQDRWRGYGWYRKTIYLESAPNADWAWSSGFAVGAVSLYVNGTLVAERGSFGAQPRTADSKRVFVAPISQTLLRTGANTLAIRVYDPSYDGGIPFGPTQIGPAALIKKNARDAEGWSGATRFLLGVFALAFALLQIAFRQAGSGSHKHAWLSLSGVCLAVYVFEGTAIINDVFSNPELALRIGTVTFPIALLGVMRYLEEHYGPTLKKSRWTAFIFLAWALVNLLSPHGWIYWTGETCLVFGAIAVSLVGAHFVGPSVKRGEAGSIFVFVAIVVLLLASLYDGLSIATRHATPPLMALGVFLLLGTTSLTSLNSFNADYRAVLREMTRYRKRLEAQRWSSVLDATAISNVSRGAFLDVIVNEVAREIDVRRCSIALADSKGQLRVLAAVGLPRSAQQKPLELENTVTGWVFETGAPLTDDTLPSHLQMSHRPAYSNPSFVCHPIIVNDRTAGVLSVSNRNDGGGFGMPELLLVSETAAKLGIVLARLCDDDSMVETAPRLETGRTAVLKSATE